MQLHTTLPQKEKKEQQVLEPEQISTLLKAVTGTEMEIPVLLTVWLCMRASEIMGLTWDCIDFDQGKITVKKALVRDKDNAWVEKTTKTISSTRTIGVPDYIMDKLQSAKEEATTEHVVNIKSGGLYKRLKTILRRNGLPDIRFHDVRHTAASVMLMLNIPDLYAQRRGGWATNHTMKAVYQHLMDSKPSAVDTAIDDYYYELMRPAGRPPQNM